MVAEYGLVFTLSVSIRMIASKCRRQFCLNDSKWFGAETLDTELRIRFQLPNHSTIAIFQKEA